MTNLSTFQPFLIGSGTTKTGFFQYLESWVKPEDAFDTLEDAYINRGQIWKREGQTLLGVLKYCSDEVVGFGTGASGAYSGTMNTHLTILAGSVVLKTINAGGTIETYTDNGAQVLTGSEGSAGTINYTTGAWTITSVVTMALVNGSPIMMDYTYTPSSATGQNKNKSVAALGTGAATRAGTFTKNLPMTAGSVIMTARQSNGTETYTDNGANVLTGSAGGTGTINYTTGAWFIDPAGAATIVNNSPITISFTGPSTTLTIMGINQWNNEANNTFTLCVEDCRRMSTYDINTQTFDPVCTVNETLFITPNASNGSVVSFDNGSTGITPTFPLIAPLSITMTLVNTLSGATVETWQDNGMGTINAPTATYLASGKVDYTTGRFEISLVPTVDPAPTTWQSGWAINVSLTLQNDYFSGDQSNLFNWTNWEPSTNRIVTSAANAEDPTQFQQGFLYLTNNVDPITLFNGTDLSRPAFAVKQANLGLGKNEITKALDVKTFASRLLIVRPTTTISNGNPDPQSIRWSAQFQPTNTVSDIPGSGGELSAATSDWIQSTKFLKDFIVVSMQNSTWTFRFTGSAFAPFQFFRLNATKNCSAPYGSIEFDDMITAMGSKGLTYCDGNATERYDLKIFDQFEDINATSFTQCFGQRFDALNQSWMLYPDSVSNATLSTKVLLYNYMEDSWAIFNMPLSCLGLGFGVRDNTWADMTFPWEEASSPWNSYLEQKESLRLLGGDFAGQVLQLNDGADDNGTPVIMNILTKKYNPYAKDGLRANFGYLDVYYTVNPEVTLTFNFFVDNNSNAVALTQNIALVGTTGADYGWQRIFVNIQASQLQWQIVDNGLTSFRILGQILWAREAGRITQ